MPVVIDESRRFDLHAPVLVVGAGACGLVTALAARDAGAEVLVLERDAAPAGSTALSSGFIPACETRWQREKRVVDPVAQMVADVRRKNHDQADPRVVEAVCRASGPTLEWLADSHGVPFVLVEGFLPRPQRVAHARGAGEDRRRADGLPRAGGGGRWSRLAHLRARDDGVCRSRQPGARRGVRAA
jgi:fumarate reductase flavoprotein subunit